MKKLAIIILNRNLPKVTDKLYNKLKKSNKETDIYIFSDGYKGDADKNDVLQVRRYLETISGFNSIVITEASENKGLASSVITGVSEVVAKFGKVIVLEDDLLVSSNFLDFMNEALNFYKDEQKVWSISGYSPKLPGIEGYNEDVYLSLRGCSWGWASWENRWNSIDWEVNDFKRIKNSREMRKKFELGGNDLFKMLDLQMLGAIDSWAIRWCFSQFLQHKYTVYPSKSKVLNDGFADEKAVHNNGREWHKFHVTLNDESFRLVNNLDLNVDILRKFRSVYRMTFFSNAGYFLKRYVGYELAKNLKRSLRLMKLFR